MSATLTLKPLDEQLAMPCTPSLALRPRTAADDDFVFGLFAELKTAELQAGQWDAALLKTLLNMQFEAHEQHLRANFAHADDALLWLGATPVGRLVVQRAASHIHLVEVVVLAAQRNRGLGSAVMAALQHEARQQQLPLRLNCWLSNTPALRWYARLGFAVVGGPPLHPLLEYV